MDVETLRGRRRRPARPRAATLEAAFAKVREIVTSSYGIAVLETEICNGGKGDLDGSRILLPLIATSAERLFLLLHLFGHTVQWNTSARAREIGYMIPVDPSDALLAELAAYEEKACRLSMRLLSDAGFPHLQRWLSELSRCDIAYLMHFYKTGEKRPHHSFFNPDAPLLTPLDIPPFAPQKWISRQQGIVI